MTKNIKDNLGIANNTGVEEEKYTGIGGKVFFYYQYTFFLNSLRKIINFSLEKFRIVLSKKNLFQCKYSILYNLKICFKLYRYNTFELNNLKIFFKLCNF